MNILYTHTNGKYWNKKQKLTENNYNYNYNQMLWYVHQKKKKKWALCICLRYIRFIKL